MRAVWERVAELLMQGVPTREAWDRARSELEPEYRFRRFLEAWESGAVAALPFVRDAAAAIAAAVEQEERAWAAMPWHRKAWSRMRSRLRSVSAR